MTYSLQEAFNISLARYHRRHCWKCLGECSLASLRLTAFGSVPLALCVRWAAEAGLCSEHVFWGVVAVGFCVVLCLSYGRRRPHFKDSARCFDRLCQTDSAVVNGLELVRSGAEDAFSLYAIRIGLEALREGGETAPVSEGERKLRGTLGSAVLLLVSMLVVYVPLPWGGSACGERVAVGRVGDSELRLVSQYEGSDLERVARWVQGHQQSASGQRAAVSSGRLQTVGQVSASQGAGDGQGEERASALGAGGNGQDSGTASGTKDDSGGEMSPCASSEQGAGTSRGSGGGTLNGDGAEASKALQASAAGSSGVQQGKGGELRPQRMEGHRKGVAGPDQQASSPMASRERGEEDGDDDATEGRGGENAHKKSRGAAPMLPVVPEPDTVQGRLGAGCELRAVKASSAVSSESSADVAGSLRDEPETVRVENRFPDRLRTRLRIRLKAKEK